MRLRNRIAVILLATVAFATASAGANYIQPEAVGARDRGRTGNGGETKEHIAAIGEVEQQRNQPHSTSALPRQGTPVLRGPSEPNSTDTIRGRKTLALLLLMLRDGRGAR